MLETADMERLREVFVTRRDCDEVTEETACRFSGLERDVAVVSAKLNTLIGILSAIGVAVLGIAVKLLFA